MEEPVIVDDGLPCPDGNAEHVLAWNVTGQSQRARDQGAADVVIEPM